jgi:hypothetical protein
MEEKVLMPERHQFVAVEKDTATKVEDESPHYYTNVFTVVLIKNTKVSLKAVACKIIQYFLTLLLLHSFGIQK